MRNAKLYQMISNDENHSKIFASLKELGDSKINLDDYELVGIIGLNEFEKVFGNDIDNLLEAIFTYGNSSNQYYRNNPNARSISMSDIIEIDGNHYYVDRFGFTNVNDRLENTKIEESVDIVNKDEETYDRLYLVNVDAGAGGVMYPYKVWALNEAHALEVLSAYLLKDAPGLITKANEVEDFEEAMENDIYVDGTMEGAEEPVFFNINTQIEDITDEPLKENKTVVEALCDNEEQVKNNLKIQLMKLGMEEDQALGTIDAIIAIFNNKVNPITESLKDYQDKLSISYFAKIFTQMRKNGWDGDEKTADKYFDDIMRQLDPNFKESEPEKEEEPLREAENDEILLPSQENPEETKKFINGYLDYMYNKVTKVGIEESKLEESKKLEEDNHEMEHDEGTDPHLDIEGNEKSILDYIQDRIGQVITIGEFNTIMQSIFGMFNEIFLQVSEVYNQDPGEPQEVTIWDDDDAYVITYNIVDEMEPTIEITDVEIQ